MSSMYVVATGGTGGHVFPALALARELAGRGDSVTFLTDAPPPIVKLGDPVWDEHVVTRAKSPDEARAAFPGPLRQLLQTSGFRGHLEVRPGGLILHCADLKPLPQHYADLGQRLLRVVDAALR